VKPLGLAELVGLEAYEGLRDGYRSRLIALKRDRRLAVGDRVTLVFENRETMRFQVQEMLRAEGLRDPARIQHELDVYNELVPGRDELSATLLIEITDAGTIRAELDRLLGIDGCVFLVLGAGPGALRIRASFDARQLDSERISAVHYLRFRLPAGSQERLADPAAPAAIAVEHPRYAHAAPLPPRLRASLASDLAGDAAPLLEVPPGAGVLDGAPSPAAAGRIRVRPAEPPAGPGHVVVEPIRAGAALLDLEPGLEAELWAAVRREARAVLLRHGACRVQADAHATSVRWHVYAPTP
jgi:hypothetical protein